MIINQTSVMNFWEWIRYLQITRSIATLDFIPLSSTDCCTRRIFSYSDYNGIQIIMGFLRPNHSNQMCDFSAIWRAESMESSTTFFAAFLASYLAVTNYLYFKQTLGKHNSASPQSKYTTKLSRFKYFLTTIDFCRQKYLLFNVKKIFN